MEIKSVLLIILIIVLLYIIVNYMTSGATAVTYLTSGSTLQQIPASVLAKSGASNSTNFSYSIWFYINDWNYRYGEEKVLFGRMGGTSTSAAGSSTVSGTKPCPLVTLGSIQNNLQIKLGLGKLASGVELTSDDTTTSEETVHSCNVSNIPIQKWVNLLISTYGRTLDVYLDGKLVKTCVLPGVANVIQEADVFVTPNGGFSGWTSKLQYFATSTDPQAAWNIYKKGYGLGFLSGLFKYQVKVALTENGTEQSSYTF